MLATLGGGGAIAGEKGKKALAFAADHLCADHILRSILVFGFKVKRVSVFW